MHDEPSRDVAEPRGGGGASTTPALGIPQGASLETDLGRPSPLRGLWRGLIREKAALCGVVLLLLIVLLALVGPLIRSTAYDVPDFGNTDAPPSGAHPLGTDALGRDLLARLMIAVRVSLLVAVLSQVFAIIFATAYGVMAGMARARVQDMLMRAVDIIMAIPELLLVILILPFVTDAGVAEGLPGLSDLNSATSGAAGLVIAIALITWVGVVRIVRAQVLSLRESDFIAAATVMGASRRRIMTVHLLPNLTSTLIVAASLGIPGAVLVESATSFIGLGVQPPTPSLGALIKDGVDAMRSDPIQLLGPALTLGCLVLCINLIGDFLRDYLDPRYSREG